MYTGEDFKNRAARIHESTSSLAAANGIAHNRHHWPSSYCQHYPCHCGVPTARLLVGPSMRQRALTNLQHFSTNSHLNHIRMCLGFIRRELTQLPRHTYYVDDAHAHSTTQRGEQGGLGADANPSFMQFKIDKKGSFQNSLPWDVF